MCHRRICVVLLVGIPGSGKSFFRHFFENYMKNNNKTVFGPTKIYSFCYDDYISLKNPSLYCGGNKWKNERLQVMKDVKNVCVLLKENNDRTISELYTDVIIVNGDVEKPNCTILLIDDNMYFRSMRHEYFKLGKAYNLSFCQIFFDISLEKALLRNKQRPSDSQVPERIIKTMFSKIEPPQPARNLWEENSVSISSYADFQDENILNSITTCIISALKSPLKSVNLNSIQEESKQITNSNALHQIDNTLKQLVSFCIKQKLKENTEKPNLISLQLSDRKQKVFQQIKDGTLILPIDLNVPVDSGKIEMIKPILLDLLQT